MGILDIFRRGRLNRTPEELARSLKTNYERGNWMPGPNAHWALKHPHEHVKTLRKSSATKPINLGSKALAPSPSAAPPAKAEPAPSPAAAAAQSPATKPLGSGVKPPRVRDRDKEYSLALREIVKKMGGISLGSLETMGFDVKAMMESGLAWRGLFRRDGGRDITEVATQLHNEGHIEVPGVVHHGPDQKTMPQESAQFLLDGLVNKVKSLHADAESKYEKEYASYLKEQQDAERAGISPNDIAEATRAGEADGNAQETEGDVGGDDSGLADEGGGISDEGVTDTGEADDPWANPGPEAKEPAATHFDGKKSPDEMVKSLKAKPAEAEPPAAEQKITPEAQQFFSSLKVGQSGYPEAVTKAIRKFASWVKPGSAEFDDMAQDASMAVLQAASKSSPSSNPEGFAYTAASNKLADVGTAGAAQKRGKEKTKAMSEGFDAEAKGGKKGSADANAIREAAASLQPEQQRILEMMQEGHKSEEIAAELGTSKAGVSRKLAEIRKVFEERGLEHFLHELTGEKERYEYGPRHSMPKRIDGAIARLEALQDYADDIGEEELAEEIDSIAREFSADDLKEIAKGFGLKHGLSTKASTVRVLFDAVCKEKE